MKKKLSLASTLLFLLIFLPSTVFSSNFELGSLFVDFNYSERPTLKYKKKFYYSLDNKELNSGKIQIFNQLYKKSDINFKRSPIIKVCDDFSDNLLNSSYNRLVMSRVVYLIENLKEDFFKADLIKNDPEFREIVFKQASFYIPYSNSKYDFITTQKLPSGFDDVRVGGKTNYYSYEDLREDQLDLFEELNGISSNFLIGVTFTELIDPRVPIKGSKYKMTKKTHPYFKGNLSFSFYYKLPKQKNNVLVLTYQVAGLRKPSYLNDFILRQGIGLFLGNAAENVLGLRKYYKTH